MDIKIKFQWHDTDYVKNVCNLSIKSTALEITSTLSITNFTMIYTNIIQYIYHNIKEIQSFRNIITGCKLL